MRMKMMKRNLKLKKRILKYGRLPYLSSKNSLSSIFPTFLNNLFFFESKKSNVYLYKMSMILKIIFVSYIYTNSISKIFLENTHIPLNFSKKFTNKAVETPSIYLNSFSISFEKNSFSTTWENSFKNNFYIYSNVTNPLHYDDDFLKKNLDFNHYSEYLYTYFFFK